MRAHARTAERLRDKPQPPKPAERLRDKPQPPFLLLLLALLAAPSILASSLTPAGTNGGPTVLVVVGAAGESEFGDKFTNWAVSIEKAAKAAGREVRRIGTSPETNDLEQLKLFLSRSEKTGARDLWLILLGHGTFDGREAKFNLRGPDLTPALLKEWLQGFERPLAILNLFSASAPFLSGLSRSNTAVVSSTRSGGEQNFSRLGEYVSKYLASPEADLDKDGQTSLLESFLYSTRSLAEFYEKEGRLATEHPLIDDNGDGRGTPAEWFRGIRVTKKSGEEHLPDGLRAHQFHLQASETEGGLPAEIKVKRDALELQIAALREKKGTLEADEYYKQLEVFLLDLARLYQGLKK